MLQIEIFGNPFEAFRGTYASLKALDGINTKAANQLTDLQFSFMSRWLDASATHLTQVTEAEGCKDLWRSQTDIINRWGGLVTRDLQKVFDVFADYQGRLNHWLHDGAIDTLDGGPNSVPPRKEAASKKSV